MLQKCSLSKSSVYPEPILAGFTGMRITKFEGRLGASSTNHTCIILNPKIRETAQYGIEFSRVGDKVKVFGAYSKLTLSVEINEVDKRTVAELKILDPKIHAVFHREGMVVQLIFS